MKIIEYLLKAEVNYSKKDEIYNDRILKEFGYKILNKRNQLNSINGTLRDKSCKFFFKLIRIGEKQEIVGYAYLSQLFPVSKIKQLIIFKDYILLIFFYENSIGNNCGLLNDYIVRNEINKRYECPAIRHILKFYANSLRKTILRDEYPMMKFFNHRVEPRLIKWYNQERLFNYRVVINGKESISTRKIINETIKYFSVKRKYLCAITQGDPNLLNIGTAPIWFDYDTSGYNSILAEFSTFLWSELIADMYFCPKYHRESYCNHENIEKIMELYNNEIKYRIDSNGKSIFIKSKIITSPVRKSIIKEYILMLRELKINIPYEIIYFLVMRILCVFDLKNMEEKDYFYSLAILHMFYSKVERNNTLDSIEKIVNSLDGLYKVDDV